MYTQHKLRSTFPLIFTVKDQNAILAQLKQILSDPNTFTFSELFEIENVNMVCNIFFFTISQVISYNYSFKIVMMKQNHIMNFSKYSLMEHIKIINVCIYFS